MSLPSLNELDLLATQRMALYSQSKAILGVQKKSLRKARTLLLDAQEGQRIAQIVASTIQQQAHKKVAKVVSRCLEAVFNEPYEFRIVFEQKRGKTQARLVFTRDGMDIDPMTASGGGVVDVAAFALRLSCLLLNKPPLRKVLVLDEPFRFVSEEYRPAVKELLMKLAKEMRIQFIIVTHMKELETGMIIRL